MARNRAKSTGKGNPRPFVMFPRRVLRSKRLLSLSTRAASALLYLAAQYDGYNNGDLGIAWKIAKQAGLRSNDSLRRGTIELIEAGFVVVTRQGGRNRCSLYGLTWFSIDHCGGKLDLPATHAASINWKELDSGLPEKPIATQCDPTANPMPTQ